MPGVISHGRPRPCLRINVVARSRKVFHLRFQKHSGFSWRRCQKQARSHASALTTQTTAASRTGQESAMLVCSETGESVLTETCHQHQRFHRVPSKPSLSLRIPPPAHRSRINERCNSNETWTFSASRKWNHCYA